MNWKYYLIFVPYLILVIVIGKKFITSINELIDARVEIIKYHTNSPLTER